jgi:hypothetical protein
MNNVPLVGTPRCGVREHRYECLASNFRTAQRAIPANL